jgi:hypothetical protein
MTDEKRKKLNRLREILQSKHKKEIAKKHQCSVPHIRNILLGYRTNEEILETCIQEAQKILKEEKEKTKKLSKIKL